jgi:hypothetical protein
VLREADRPEREAREKFYRQHVEQERARLFTEEHLVRERRFLKAGAYCIRCRHAVFLRLSLHLDQLTIHSLVSAAIV